MSVSFSKNIGKLVELANDNNADLSLSRTKITSDFSMAYDLVWTPEAEDDFKAIILFLKKTGQQSANKFITLTYNRLERLAVMPSVAPPTSHSSVYMYKLDRKNVLFFSIEG